MDNAELKEFVRDKLIYAERKIVVGRETNENDQARLQRYNDLLNVLDEALTALNEITVK